MRCAKLADPEAEINTPAHRHHRGADRLGGGALVCPVFRRGESSPPHFIHNPHKLSLFLKERAQAC